MAKIKDGDIIQIPLPNGLGFAYAKYIDLTKINSNCLYPSMIRVYRLRTKEEKVDINYLQSKDLIISPLLVGGIQSIIKKGTWKILKQTQVSVLEYVIPDYKYSDIVSIKEGTKKWYYINNADISKKFKSAYENVKHLEPFGAVGTELVGTKIAMEFLKAEDRDIKDYFELKEYYEKIFYEQVLETPVYFNQPDYMRDKAIESSR